MQSRSTAWIKDGGLHGHDLGTVPLGQGDHDLRLLRVISESGWQGPVGIILEVEADAKVRLQDNLDGLGWLVAQLEGRPASPKPQPRSWHPPKATPGPKGDSAPTTAGHPENHGGPGN